MDKITLKNLKQANRARSTQDGLIKAKELQGLTNRTGTNAIKAIGERLKRDGMIDKHKSGYGIGFSDIPKERWDSIFNKKKA